MDIEGKINLKINVNTNPALNGLCQIGVNSSFPREITIMMLEICIEQLKDNKDILIKPLDN